MKQILALLAGLLVYVSAALPAPQPEHPGILGLACLYFSSRNIVAPGDEPVRNSWKVTEESKISRQSKWQLSRYDPDGTRVGHLEFTPEEDSCCSPYIGWHAGPNQ